MSFKVSSLEELSTCVVGKNVNNGLDCYKLEIPNHLKENVFKAFEKDRTNRFRNFLMCSEIPDWISIETGQCTNDNGDCPIHGEDDIRRRAWLLEIREAFLEMNDWTVPVKFPKDIYAFIMFLGTNYHSWFLGPELGVWQHLVFQHYMKKLPTGIFVNLCRECFEKDDNWCNFDYYFSKIHRVVYETEVLNWIQNKYSWCSNCITMPLFEMYDRAVCKSKWGGHESNTSRHPMFWGFNELFNESEEVDAYSELIVSVKHPRA